MQEVHNPAAGVSVLMCANRDDAFLALAIDSILNQTFSNLEIVLVANGVDRDGIYDRYASLDPRLVVLKSDFYGLTTNLNIGLARCSNNLIARMDSDDISLPERIEVQVDCFNMNPLLTVCGSSYERIDRQGNTIGVVELPSSDQQIRRLMPWKNPICHPSVMFKRAAVADFGGYLSGVYAEDYDLWVRMGYSKEVVFFNVNRPLIQYRIWPTTARGSAGAYETSAYACFSAFLRGQGMSYLGGAFFFALKWARAVAFHRQKSAAQ